MILYSLRVYIHDLIKHISSHLNAIYAQMASEAADRFLRDLRMLGLDSDDAIRLLKERKDTDHA